MYDKHTEEQEQAAHRPKPGNEITAKSELVLERLLAAHGAWFDVSQDVSVAGRAFRALAQFHSFGEQYVLVKRVKLWEAEEHEYMLFDVRDHIDAEAARSYVEFMKNEALELVGRRYAVGVNAPLLGKPTAVEDITHDEDSRADEQNQHGIHVNSSIYSNVGR